MFVSVYFYCIFPTDFLLVINMIWSYMFCHHMLASYSVDVSFSHMCTVSPHTSKKRPGSNDQ